MSKLPLILGPLLRHVDATSASLWVETRDAATVAVRAAGRTWRARTFGVHGHHYALVEVDGLEPGSRHPYQIDIDGAPVWPPPDSPFPPSVIPTLSPDRPLRLAYGSCRTSVAHDAGGNRTHGVDALRAYALRMAAGDDPEPLRWPDFVLFLGDQVYADETTDEMKEFIAARRDLDEAPWTELADFEEYAELYRLAWSDPANRWLLSTLPSSMIFDDHDIRDDWNTSQTWKEEMEATSWWRDRIVAGLGSYWVYQHLGNLSPAERAEDELWQAVVAGDTNGGEVDLGDRLDAFAHRVDQDPATYRWSYCRDLGEVRLIVLDSRAARVLDQANRSMLDPDELSWLDERMRGGFRHLLVGTSLPLLLSPGLHHIEAWDEALARGAWGRLGARLGERLRQLLDLEHWPAFQHGFTEVADMALAVAHGERGPAPSTVTFLSGDVHHSYVSEVHRVRGRQGPRSRIVQAVCSPIRNPLSRSMRLATAVASYGVAGPVGALAARSAHVPEPPFTWRLLRGPWFENSLAVLEDRPDGLALAWYTGVANGQEDQPGLEEVASLCLAPVRPRRPRSLLQRTWQATRAALARAWRFVTGRGR